MCLDYVERTAQGKGTRIKTGWKALRTGTSNDEFLLPYVGIRGRNTIKAGVWLESEPRDVYSYNKKYTSGFHLFTTRADALRYRPYLIVVKVRYKGVLAVGTQGGLPVTVAKFMYISKKRKTA